MSFYGETSAQTAGITTLAEPAKSNQVLAWTNSTNQNVERWRVDILKEEMVNGQPTLQPQIQFFQNKSYLGIDRQYMTSSHFYQIYGLDANGTIISTGDGPHPVAPGLSVESGCEQKCKGSSFAFGITQNTQMNNGIQGASYLSAAQAVAWSDPNTSTVTPYFHYIGATAWIQMNNDTNNVYLNRGLKIIRFRKSDIPSINFVKTADGVGISDDLIIGVEKRMGSIGYSFGEDFEILSGQKTVMLANKKPCDPQLANFTSIFNQYNELVHPIQTAPYVPTLACDSDPNDFLMSNDGVLFTTDPTGNNSDTPDALSDFAWIWPSAYWENDGSGTSKGIISFDELKHEVQLKTNPNYINPIAPNTLIQFEFQEVDNPNSYNIVKPIDILQEDGSLSLNSITLNSGLYCLNIINSDNVIYSIYFENLLNDGDYNNNLSNFLNTNIYQVPIVGYEYNVDINSSKDMTVLYQAYNLNGDLLLEEEIHLLAGEKVIYHGKLNSSQNYPSNTIVNKFTCLEDGSFLTTQTLLSIN